MNHKKPNARTNARRKIVLRDHLSQDPALPLTGKQINQKRFTGQTPLTGEDRPLEGSGGKQEAFDSDAQAEHGAAGHPDMKRQGRATMGHPNSRQKGIRQRKVPNKDVREALDD